MRRLGFGVGGLLLTWSCAAWCPGSGGGAQECPQPPTHKKAESKKAEPKDEGRPEKGPPRAPPQGEDLLSPQELTDRLLVVRARLDKPGPVPEYKLGEPIYVVLDIRNMTERHLFNIPLWGIAPAGGIDTASNYVVEARRYGKPVPLTVFGRRSVELLRRNLPVEVRWSTQPFDDDREHPRLRNGSHTEQPTPAQVMANLLSDLSDYGEYELVVKFRVDVLMEVDGLVKPVSAVKVVSPTPSLRLSIVNRFYGVRPIP